MAEFSKTLGVVIGAMLLVSPVFAQTPLTLSIDPPSIHSSAKPGNNTTKIVSIDNPSNQTVRVKIYAQDWNYLQDGSKNFLEFGSTPFSMKGNLELFANEIFLKPNESQQVFVKLTSPKDRSGGLLSVVFFEAWSVTKTAPNSNVKLIGRIGTIIYHEIEGTVTHNLMASFPKEISSTSNMQVPVTIENKGNVVEFEPISFLLISPSKQVIDRVAVADVKLLPGEKKIATLNLSKSVKPGNYSVIVSFQTSAGPLFSSGEMVIK